MKAILDKRVAPGMVFRFEPNKPERIVKRIDSREVCVIDFDGKWSASLGYGWFETGQFEFVRQMGVREFNKLTHCK